MSELGRKKWRGKCDLCDWNGPWYWDQAYAYWEFHEHCTTIHNKKLIIGMEFREV